MKHGDHDPYILYSPLEAYHKYALSFLTMSLEHSTADGSSHIFTMLYTKVNFYLPQIRLKIVI